MKKPTRILAIDPGPEQSAWVRYYGKTHDPIGGYCQNSDLLGEIEACGHIAMWFIYETIECFGMPVGASTFLTCEWIGRFKQAFNEDGRVFGVPRSAVRSHLCHSMKAKDSNISQALYDRWDGKDKAVGGMKCPACKGKGWRGRGRFTCNACEGSGYKFPPGPLFGMNSHVHQALAVAVTWWETKRNGA